MPRQVLLLLALLGACRRDSPPAAPAAPPAAAAGPDLRPAGPRTPRSPAELSTTDGEIAQGNLDAQIRGRERALQAGLHPAHVAILVEAYLQRAQFLGRLSDYDRALALTERFLKEARTQPGAYLLRARVRAALHRFAQAEADLQEARRLGLEAGQGDGLAVSLLHAQGRLDEAAALAERLADAVPHILSIGLAAALAGERGDLRRAEALFSRAQDSFRDVTPFPLAWLYLQEGLLWEREGRPGRARDLYVAARERLPAYAAAVSHLAAIEAVTGGRARAIELLRPVAERAEDPEYKGQLAALLQAEGRTAEASRLRAEARAGYEALLEHHPEAFLSQAARFFLSTGEPARALALAERNLLSLRDRAAHELAIEAAAAVGPPAGCAVAAREEHPAPPALMQRPWPRLHVLLARVFAVCGQADRARVHLEAVTRDQPASAPAAAGASPRGSP